MDQVSLNFTKNYFLTGELNAKYKSLTKNTRKTGKKIELLNVNIENVQICSEETYIKSAELSELSFHNVKNASIKLENNPSTEGYLFNENISSLRIFNPELSNHLLDGSVVYGELTGRTNFIIGEKQELILPMKKKVLVNSEIIIPEIDLERRQEKSINFFKWLLWALLVIFLLYVLIMTISQIDFSSKAKKFEQYKDEVVTYVTSRSISLVNRSQHHFVRIKMGNRSYEFMLDTGASMTTVPSYVIDELIQDKVISTELNFLRRERFSIADGKSVEGSIWIVPRIIIDSEVLYNVEIASISSDNAPFLLGMSTLNKLGKYFINPSENKIIIYK